MKMCIDGKVSSLLPSKLPKFGNGGGVNMSDMPEEC